MAKIGLERCHRIANNFIVFACGYVCMCMEGGCFTLIYGIRKIQRGPTRRAVQLCAADPARVHFAVKLVLHGTGVRWSRHLAVLRMLTSHFS